MTRKKSETVSGRPIAYHPLFGDGGSDEIWEEHSGRYPGGRTDSTSFV